MKKKILPIILSSVLLLTSSMPVYAEDVVVSTEGQNKIDLSIDVAGSFSVTLPKKIVISGTPDENGAYKVNYTVSADLNIPSEKQLTVAHPDAVMMASTNFPTIGAGIVQDEALSMTHQSTTGTITLNTTFAGKFTGSFNFDVSLDDREAGIYKEGKLIASWDEMVANGEAWKANSSKPNASTYYNTDHVAIMPFDSASKTWTEAGENSTAYFGEDPFYVYSEEYEAGESKVNACYICIKSEIDEIIIPAEAKWIREINLISGNPSENITCRLEEGIKGFVDSGSVSSKITNIKLPDSITYIGSSALQNSKITNMSSSIRGIGVNGCDNTDIENLVLPSSLKYLHNFAFANCKKLKSVVFGNEITKLPVYLFEDCTALESVTLPSGLKVIEPNAFYGCSSLKVLELPEGLEQIHGPFLQGAGVEEITLPTTLTVAMGMLNGANSIKVINVPDNYEPSQVQNMLGGCNYTATINYRGQSYAGWTAFCQAMAQMQNP